MRIGLVSSHGFGDCLWNMPLINQFAASNPGAEIVIGVSAHCKDAFDNVPYKVVTITDMYSGLSQLQHIHGCDIVHQITQNALFTDFGGGSTGHSLVDTPSEVGRRHGLPPFNPKPQIYLSQSELNHVDRSGGLIAIEAVYTSAQSWCDGDAIDAILHTHRNDAILWLSHTTAPAHTRHIKNRRQGIANLPYCERFYSVGSGFFCASLAEGLAPKKTICMWTDGFYKYENRLRELGYNITWVHNHAELNAAL